MEMIYNFFTSILFLLITATPPTTNIAAIEKPNTEIAETSTVNSVEMVYQNLKANSFSLPNYESFAKAFQGYTILKQKGKIKKDLLTLIDFSKSSNTKRLWIIDMKTKTILYNTLVAHGRNSGDEFATSFSNTSSSYKSSLGFYATGEIYNGKHGASLRLDGLEKGLNSNARSRAVVMHAADYVSEKFIQLHNRLGRSQGCPALPNKLNKEIINLIQGKSCLYIYHPSQTSSNVLKLVS